jgi:hypothetical protein
MIAPPARGRVSAGTPSRHSFADDLVNFPQSATIADMSAADPFNPMDYRIALELRPKRVSPTSAWVSHIPFAYALVQMCRPRVLVELGTHKGDSYCAFCQAVAAIGAAARCTAIDTWQGDPQAGAYGPDVLADLRAHHDPLYGGFSTLLQSTFDDARPRFDDRSIDILHIDGFHSYDAVRHDYESWLPKISERGVMLFHDTRDRRPDFGVWRLWQQIAPSGPSFEFPFGAGLGVLVVGNEAPPALLRFIAIGNREPDAVNLFFSQLGQAIERLRVIRACLGMVHQLLGALDEHDARCVQRNGGGGGAAERPAPATEDSPRSLKQVFDDPIGSIDQLSSRVRKLLHADV